MSDEKVSIQRGWVKSPSFAPGGSVSQNTSSNGQCPFLECDSVWGHGRRGHEIIPPPNRAPPLEQPDPSPGIESASPQVGPPGELSGFNVHLYTFGEEDEPVSIDSLDAKDVGYLWFELRVSENMTPDEIHMWFRRVEKSLRKGLDGQDTIVIVLWHRARHMRWVARQILDKLDRRGIKATWLMPVEVIRQHSPRTSAHLGDPRQHQSNHQRSDDHGNLDGHPYQSPARSERRYGRYFGRLKVLPLP